MDPIQKIIAYFLRLKTVMARRRKALLAAAAVVVFVVAYALTLPAITLDRDLANQQSGISLEQTANQGDVSEASGTGTGQAQQSAAENQTESQEDGQSEQAGTGQDQQAQDEDADSDRATTSAAAAGPSASQDPDTVTGEPAEQAKMQDAQQTENAQAVTAEGLPAGVQLQATEVDIAKDKDAYDGYYIKALDKLKESDPEVEGLGGSRFFEIAFVDATGQAADVENDAMVIVAYADAMSVDDAKDVKVVRIAGGENASSVSVLDDDEVEPSVSDGHMDKVSFKASENAVYGVVLVDRKDAQAADDGNVSATESVQRTITAENDSYRVSLTYDESAGLPEGAKLRISNVLASTDEYRAARDAVVSAKKAEDAGFDEESLGLAAVDVSVLDANDNEIEPTGTVQVSIEAKGLPEEASESGVAMQHIVESAEGGQGSSDGRVAQTVADGVTVDGTSASAQFEVTGFSVFTITWTTKSGENDIRFANVKVHYVDENGLELEDPQTVPAAELGDGSTGTDNIVDLATWAYTTDASGNATTTSRVDGYTFAGARIGTLTGTAVTGLKAEKDDATGDAATYKLYYTGDGTVASTSAWTQYTDATSGTTSNNADVYLVYEKAEELKVPEVPVTIHCIDRSGKALTDASGNEITKTVDAAEWGDSWRSLQGYGDTINGYIKGDHGTLVAKSGSSLSYARVSSGGNLWTQTTGSVSGYGFRYLRYVTVGSGKSFQAGDGTGGSSATDPTSVGSVNRYWTVTGDFDVYLPYSPADTLTVTIHHVDTSGTTVNADTTASVSDGGSVSLSNAASVDGYSPTSISYGYGSPTSTGTSFTTLSYAKGDTAWTSSADSTATTNLVTEVWIVYTPKQSTDVTVHHVDASGNVLHSPTTVSKADGSTLTPSDSGLAQSIAGYSATGEGYFVSGGSQQAFASIGYDYDATTSSWKTTYRETADGDGQASASPITDVYLTYTKATQTMVFHHVDSTGTKLHEDTQLAITDSQRDNTSGYGNHWNGFSHIGTRAYSTNLTSDPFKVSGLGDWQRMIVGDRTSETEAVITTSNNWGLFYRYDTSAGTWQTGVGSTMSSPNVTKDGFVTDIYNVYANKGIVVHHVDATGRTVHDDTYANVASGNTVTASDLAVSGYALVGGHLGSSAGDAFYSITYTKDSDDNWGATYRVSSSATTSTTASSPINEVWLVYNPNAVSKTITGHYVNQGDDGTYSATDTADVSFTISTDTSGQTGTGMGDGGNPQYVLMGDGVNTASNEEFFGTTANPKEVKSSDGSTTLSYVTTRVGSEDGPELSWVKIGDDGQLYYLSGNTPTEDGNASSTITLARQGGRNVWVFSSNSRTYTLTKDASGNFSLNDSLTGRFDLNLTSADADGIGTYTATYQGENQVTQYSVKLSEIGRDNETNYTLTIEDWVPSDGTDIYFVYRDANNDLYIDNDLIYSGRLKVAYSDSVTNRRLSSYSGTDAIRNATYTWYKVTTTDTSATVDTINTGIANGTIAGTEVIRTQSGTDWNIAYEQGQRTWLDVAADDGARTTGTRVFYYVTMSYTNAEGEAQMPLRSEPVEIEYYGQLENGSFETPDILDANGRQTNGFTGNQTSNASYKAHGGIWQTTGIGDNSVKAGSLGHDIEIFNVNQGNTGLGNYWRNGKLSTNTSAKDTPVAKDGDQFAELNCENAGALYQDVITHPNEELSYWLSHRARISNNSRTQSQDFYDSMYLVIMPTKIAMTAGDDGGELDTQDELEAFIAKHGGFDEAKATAEENRVTYQEDDAGIFIRRISSDNYDWHTIQEYASYLAKAGLTRFFFVAAQTSNTNNANDKTEGNFLDDVGFSQELPTPEGFNLTITKTFSGLTSAQIASLASNATDVEGHDLSDGKADHFTITLDNKHVNSSTGQEDSNAENTALNGAVLEFTASGSGGSYTFTPTATAADGTTNLFTGQSNGASRVNADGSVTLTWTFVDQSIDNTSADQQFNYTADETGEIVTGLTINTTKTVTPADAFNKEAVAITPGASGTIAYTNTYSRHRDTDQPQITVSKTFAGVTPTTVGSLWSSGYTLSVTNSAGVTSQLSAYDDQLSANAALVSTTTNDDGSMTYVWSIAGEGWGAGTYTVSEGNFRTKDNSLSQITINGTDVTPGDTTTNSVTQTGVEVADGSPGGILSYGTDANVARSETLDSTLAYTLPASTNIIIARFRAGGASSTSYHYLVWTSSPLGRTSSNAVLDKIKAQFGDSGATMDDVYFRSGNNPGTITTGGATLTYDSSTRSLTFTNTTDESQPDNDRTWTSFYSTHYNVAGSSPEAYDVQDIRVANDYQPIVKIQKVSSDSGSQPLSGAMFRLYKLGGEDGSAKLYYHASGDWNDTVVTASTFTTGEDGTVTIGTLPVASTDTTYYLEEVTAPAGYNRLTKPVSFVVKSDGAVELEGTTSTNEAGETVVSPRSDATVDNTVASVTYPDPYYQVTIADTPGTALPLTGGVGTTIFTLVGLVLITAGAVFGLAGYRHQRRGGSR